MTATRRELVRRRLIWLLLGYLIPVIGALAAAYFLNVMRGVVIVTCCLICWHAGEQCAISELRHKFTGFDNISDEQNKERGTSRVNGVSDSFAR